MAGISKGLIEVGVSMVLRDQFSTNAGKISNSFASMMNDMNTWNRGMQMSVGNAFEYGKQMVGGMYEAYKHSAAINQQIFLTSKIAGATVKEQQELMQLTQDINLKTPLTNLDISSGMKYLAMAGNPADKIRDMIPPAAELASIFELQLGGKGGVADMMTNIMATFGISSEKARETADILAVATTSANISLSDLAQSLQYSGAVFRNSGVSLSEASAAIGVLGNQGIQASSAGTALANMLRYLTLSITGQKIKGGDYLKKLGITKDQLVDAQGNLRSLEHIMKVIAKATSGLSGTERVEAYYNIFGVRGERAVSALVNAGDNMSQIIGKVENSSGFLATTIQKYLKSDQGIINMFTSSWDNLMTTIGAGFAYIFNPILGGLTDVMNWLKKIAKTGVGGFILRFAVVGTMVGLVVNGAKLLFNTFRLISGAAALFKVQTTGANAGMTRLTSQAATLEIYLQHIVALMGQYVGMCMAPGTFMMLPGGGRLGKGSTGRIYMNPKGRGGITSPATYTGRIGQFNRAPLRQTPPPVNTGSSISKWTRGGAMVSAMFGGVAGWGIAIGLTLLSYALNSSSSATEENTEALAENTEAMSLDEMRATYEERFLKALKETIIGGNKKLNEPVRLQLSINGSPYHEVEDRDILSIDDYGISSGY